VADLLNVDQRTVTRWANKGWIRVARTPGGHRRFYEEEIRHIQEAWKLAPEGQAAGVTVRNLAHRRGAGKGIGPRYGWPGMEA
jgi:excisionase family DNA binding protein